MGMRRLSLLVVAAACGVERVSGDTADGTSVAGATRGDTTDGADASHGVDPHGATLAPSDTSSGTGALADSSSTSGSDTSPCYSPSGCPLGPSWVIVDRNVTPLGPLDAAYAGFGHDACTNDELIVLSPMPLEIDGDPQYVEEGIRIVVFHDRPSMIFDGVYEAGFMDLPNGGGPSDPGTIEFLEPYDSAAPCDPDVAPRIHARAEIVGGGWDYAVEFEAPYCSSFGDCLCPCE